MNMREVTNTESELIGLLEGRREEALQEIHQFVLDMDALDYGEFLYPSDPDFVEDLKERDTEARAILENLEEIEATLLGLAHGKITLQ